jgi:hypothetical protein
MYNSVHNISKTLAAYNLQYKSIGFYNIFLILPILHAQSYKFHSINIQNARSSWMQLRKHKYKVKYALAISDLFGFWCSNSKLEWTITMIYDPLPLHKFRYRTDINDTVYSCSSWWMMTMSRPSSLVNKDSLSILSHSIVIIMAKRCESWD